jgi:hypothetical protein
MKLDVDTVSPLDGTDDWMLTGTAPDEREYHVRISAELGRGLAAVLDDAEALGGTIEVEVDDDGCVPAVQERPCPLCGHDGQWHVPTVVAALIITTCQGCGQTLSGSTVPDELLDATGALIDFVEGETGETILG